MSINNNKIKHIGHSYRIPFNKIHLTHKEKDYISEVISLGKLSGDEYYSKKCHLWLEKNIGTKKAFLTHSCSTALDMMIILIGLKQGDEVIMPSFNFTSTANAVVLQGGIPIFVDIRPDTLNINEKLIADAITPKTKAIFVVHYAGIGAEMDAILRIAKKNKLFVLEDAAHGILATYKDRYLGTMGHMGAYSFHGTKNITSGEGGSLLINDRKFLERAEIIREKGTNRTKFFKGQVDKYTWVDMGSSYLAGELVAAFLMGQLEYAKEITKRRIAIWDNYHELFKDLEKQGCLRRPVVLKHTKHNGHLYYLLLENQKLRDGLINFLKRKSILSVFHYLPLHSSPAGKKFGRFVGDMKITDATSANLIRLPLFYDLTDAEVEFIAHSVKDFFKKQ